MAYDTKCYDLAKAFLSDTPDIDSEKGRAGLAQTIQDAIEGWIIYEEGPCENCGEARGKGDHNLCHHIP